MKNTFYQKSKTSYFRFCLFFIFIFTASLGNTQTSCISDDFNIEFLPPHENNEVLASGMGCNGVEICITYEYLCDFNQLTDMGFRWPKGTLEITDLGDFSSGPSTMVTAPSFDRIASFATFPDDFPAGSSELTKCFRANVINQASTSIPIKTYAFFSEEDPTIGVSNEKELNWFLDGTKRVFGSLQQLLISGQLSLSDNRWIVDGTLVVDVPSFTLAGNSSGRGKIEMTTGSSIVVNNRSNFTIDETDVSRCTGSWESIVVQPGGRLNVTNSIISGGRNAINAFPFSNISLTNNKFTNNNIGIRTNGYGIRVGDFTDNIFTAKNVRRVPGFPSFGEAAIHLNDMWGVKFRGTGNDISLMENGVKGHSSNFSISGTKVHDLLSRTVTTGGFQSPVGGVVASGRRNGLMEIDDCSFFNLGQAVVTFDGNTTMKNSKTSNVSESFHNFRGNNVIVENNELLCRGVGIFAESTNNLQVLNNVKIEANGNPESFAIRIEGSGSETALIRY